MRAMHQAVRARSPRRLSGRERRAATAIDILSFLREYQAAHGYPATVREIRAALALSSTSVVHAHLWALAAAGRIHITPGIARGIVINGPSGPRARKAGD